MYRSLFVAIAFALVVSQGAVAQQNDYAGEFYSASCAAQSCCAQSCCSQSCCCPAWGPYAGVEATYLHMNPTNRNAVFDDTDEIGDEPFSYGLEAAPRVWVGQEFGNCWGIRGRYWQFDAEDSVDLSSDEPTFGSFHSDFEAYTIDLEFTKRMRHCCWDLLASVGARQASIDHGYRANVTDFPDDEMELFALDRRMEGTGITAALEGSCPIGCTNCSFFWSARGSVIWGDNSASGHSIELEDGVSIVTDASRESDEMVIGDAQVGLQWSQPVKCLCGARVFARGAFEYQIWDLNSNELAVLGDDDDDPTRIDALGRGDVHFYGAAFSIGIVR